MITCLYKIEKRFCSFLMSGTLHGPVICKNAELQQNECMPTLYVTQVYNPSSDCVLFFITEYLTVLFYTCILFINILGCKTLVALTICNPRNYNILFPMCPQL